MKNTPIIFQIVLFSLFIRCKKIEMSETDKYNDKANDLIFQTIEQTKCSCIGEISPESMIENSMAEIPSYDFKAVLKKQLNIKSDSDLETLINHSRDFKLDFQKLKKYNVKIVPNNELLKYGDLDEMKYSRFTKKCPKGIILIQKPIFDTKYEKAVFEYSHGFSCTRVLPSPVYKLEKGKWNKIKK